MSGVGCVYCAIRVLNGGKRVIVEVIDQTLAHIDRGQLDD